MYSSEGFFLFFFSVSLGCRHEIVIFIFLFLKCSKKIKNYKKKNDDTLVWAEEKSYTFAVSENCLHSI